MTKPICVQVNDGSAYVQYAEGVVDNTEDITQTCSVAADGTVLGIEILDVIDDGQRELAAWYACLKGFAFPRDLSGLVP
jgi:hypothetical protein